MDWHEKIIKSYDDYASEFNQSFSNYGPRIEDISLVFDLSKTGQKSRVIEIGCGVGRDAEEIVKRCTFYEGFDPSIGLLDIARKNLPNVNFVQSDAINYNYPDNINIIFAFASLLHVNKADLVTVLKKISDSLCNGGVVFMSLKEKSEYAEEVKTDEMGVERMFYYYSPEIIKSLCNGLLEEVYESHYKLGNTNWFNIVLKK